VVLLVDSLPYALRSVADEVVIAPAEGTSFFPSLTAATAVQQGIVATLASLDPARTQDAMTAAEQSWQDFKLMHHGQS
jgi:DNA-binding MurR/RpiR family transcriptional regulator